MVCHMVEADGALGRSTVIDLSAKTANKFRQVDHRSISFLILRNVKYVLSKGSKKQKKFFLILSWSMLLENQKRKTQKIKQICVSSYEQHLQRKCLVIWDQFLT